jgi:hypothetical protein
MWLPFANAVAKHICESNEVKEKKHILGPCFLIPSIEE